MDDDVRLGGVLPIGQFYMEGYGVFSLKRRASNVVIVGTSD